MYYIYRINFPNGKCYIGLTKDFKTRKNQHLYRGFKHKNDKPINRAISKYKDSISFDILEKDLSLEQANQREIDLIAEHRSLCSQNGYNISPGGNVVASYSGIKCSDSLSISKPFLVFKKETGEFIGEWNKKRLFIEETGYIGSSAGILQVLRHNKNSVNGYTFIYKEEYVGQDMSYNPIAWNKNVKQSLDPQYSLKLSLAHGSKPFYVYQKIDNLYIGSWVNARMCAEELKISDEHIRCVLSGKRKSTQGYFFTYDEPSKI